MILLQNPYAEEGQEALWRVLCGKLPSTPLIASSNLPALGQNPHEQPPPTCQPCVQATLEVSLVANALVMPQNAEMKPSPSNPARITDL